MKTWTTPELIVLVRSTPEEAVLCVCKNGMAFLNGPSVIDCGDCLDWICDTQANS